MPDPTLHVSFGREVLSVLPEEVRDSILPAPYTFALFGPDVWFLYKPFGRHESRGRRMHTTKCGEFLLSLARRAAGADCRAEMFSYLAGFLCHYALDSTTHPYIIQTTANEYPFPRSHMSMEHALDAAQMRRDGCWGEKHPVTDRYFTAVRLPGNMQTDLDAVYREVYGWENSWKDMNRACRRFRKCFRLMDNPGGLPARLARLTKKPALCSVIYSESQFHNLDPENTEHRTWTHPFDPSDTSSESFPEMRERAVCKAVSMITAAFRFVMKGEGTEEELSAVIGNLSYLSGLPADDPRNLTVPSMLPPGETGKEKP